MNRLGIDQLTHLGMPPAEQLRLAAELGAACISTTIGRISFEKFGLAEPGLYDDWSLRDVLCRRETIAALRDSGVGIANGEGFSDVSAAGDEVLRDLDIIAEIGARRINAIGVDPDPARCRDLLASLAEQTAARGMMLTIEFMPGFTVATLGDALTAIGHMGQGELLVDAMHFYRSGATLAALAAVDPALIGYAQLCDAPHSSDADYLMEAIFNRLAPGEGDLPLAEWVAALPGDCMIGLEAPQLAKFQAGTTPREHAAALVAAARSLGV